MWLFFLEFKKSCIHVQIVCLKDKKKHEQVGKRASQEARCKFTRKLRTSHRFALLSQRHERVGRLLERAVWRHYWAGFSHKLQEKAGAGERPGGNSAALASLKTKVRPSARHELENGGGEAKRNRREAPAEDEDEQRTVQPVHTQVFKLNRCFCKQMII